ncbi:MAG: HNH endonuclease [Gammaproteobacteria bacterium]|nr:HNH endonuclease [Gammaproteobacteria bacterium]
MKGYQDSLWQQFRLEVIELDGGCCNDCARSEPDVVLQVHHRRYIPGQAPWQYDYSDCETLCKGCHAARHGKVPPKSGWKYLGYENLGSVAGNCELCGSNFRYQFYVHHSNWGMMQVGADCCNALTSTELATNRLDADKKLSERKRRFINSKRWLKISGREIIRQKDIRIEISQRDAKYYIQLDRYPGEMGFESLDAAKAHVFAILEDGQAESFLNRMCELSTIT